MDALGLWPRGEESKCLEDEKMKSNIFRAVQKGTQSNHFAAMDQKDVRAVFQGSKELEGTTVHLCMLGETGWVSDGLTMPPFENQSLCQTS